MTPDVRPYPVPCAGCGATVDVSQVDGLRIASCPNGCFSSSKVITVIDHRPVGGYCSCGCHDIEAGTLDPPWDEDRKAKETP